MKLAITSTGTDLSARMDQRFGRAAYFLLVDIETMTFDVIENRQSLDLPQGAGIQAGKTVADADADLLITGFCGPKAFRVLRQAGIPVITGAEGTVQDVIDQFRSGRLKPADQPNAEGHWV